ncbi:hypothetical protein WJX84_010460 [Apatococcus fuscideae]|uniref:Uncharacterized protein n=1 Tax=Apatococcus fuscideae TaxID=2026836 RepID=A0AAW1SQ58_9CHLO
MGKHNGKARSQGLKVGAALANRSKKGRPQDPTPRNHLYTTDPKPDPTSMVETNDLNTFLQLAELADRDFSAQRGEVHVLSTGEQPKVDSQQKAAERRAAEIRNQHRPAWTAETTPAQLDHHERSAFLEWRRELAKVEEDEKLTLCLLRRIWMSGGSFGVSGAQSHRCAGGGCQGPTAVQVATDGYEEGQEETRRCERQNDGP